MVTDFTTLHSETRFIQTIQLILRLPQSHVLLSTPLIWTITMNKNSKCYSWEAKNQQQNSQLAGSSQRSKHPLYTCKLQMFLHLLQLYGCSLNLMSNSSNPSSLITTINLKPKKSFIGIFRLYVALYPKPFPWIRVSKFVPLVDCWSVVPGWSDEEGGSWPKHHHHPHHVRSNSSQIVQKDNFQVKPHFRMPGIIPKSIKRRRRRRRR